MKLLYVLLTFMLLRSALVLTDRIVDPNCNCDRCRENKISTAPDNETADHSRSILLDKDDSDGDGSLVICARDRDLGDRNFSNVCQMKCYNRCTKFRVVSVTRNNTRRYITTAYRTNYYKLKDGSC